MIKESTLDTEEHSKLFCYTLQLADQKEEADTYKKQPFVPFVDINKKTLDKLHGSSFNPLHLESEEVSEQNLARIAMVKRARLMVKNKKNIY